MDENKNIKISLTMLIFIILLIAILILIVYIAILNQVSGGRLREPIPPLKDIVDEEDDKTVGKELNSFSFDFLKMENNKKNMIYSPLSIKYALRMLEEGANGETKQQIEDVIGSEDLTKYDNIEDILSLANSLYIRDKYKENVKEKYTNILLNKYNAEVKFDSFNSAKPMNDWIENKTFGQIKNIIKDEEVTNPDNEMFLINALAIEMEWKSSFDPEDTSAGDFYLDDKQTVEATMMHQNENTSKDVSYYMDDKITAMSMDLKEYEDNEMEFIAIMPNEDNLDSYIDNFEMSNLEEISNKFTKASDSKNGVNITIPRFSFDYELSLVDDLKDLGIKDAFDSNLADFSNMLDDKLYVSNAIHKANIDFSEKGVKAEAVTVVYLTAGLSIADETPVEIMINKPFIYVIRDKNSREIWFVGAVYKPNLWENDKVNYEYR